MVCHEWLFQLTFNNHVVNIAVPQRQRLGKDRIDENLKMKTSQLVWAACTISPFLAILQTK